MEKILVAVDGSEGCQKASKNAEKLAILCDSKVTFITVLTPKSKSSYSRNQALKNIKEREKKEEEVKEMITECDRIYNKCKANLKECNIETNKVVKEGYDAANVICDFAKENNFGLIIIADKGKSNIKRFLLGSTTEKVVRHSEVSVLVAK